jgi:thiamine pyrophosphate-dependent acetolactate synthase large subunit-like protein
MGGSALWTASKHDIPLLVVVANNASFYNDEVHQRTIATTRGRPVGNASIGVALDEPSADLAGLARSLGFTGLGPVASRRDLPTTLARAVQAVQAGGRALVDVRIEPGYAADMTEALTKE